MANFICEYCGQSKDSFEKTLDHFIPLKIFPYWRYGRKMQSRKFKKIKAVEGHPRRAVYLELKKQMQSQHI